MEIMLHKFLFIQDFFISYLKLHLLRHEPHKHIWYQEVFIPYPKEKYRHRIHEGINCNQYQQFYFSHLQYKLLLEYLGLYYDVRKA